MLAADGRPALGRSHPLTVEGDDVGSFDLKFACGEPGRDYIVTYVEQRHGDDPDHAPAVLSEVEISMVGRPVQLKVMTSRPRDGSSELSSVASGRVPVEMMKAFADAGSRSSLGSIDGRVALRSGIDWDSAMTCSSCVTNQAECHVWRWRSDGVIGTASPTR